MRGGKGGDKQFYMCSMWGVQCVRVCVCESEQCVVCEGVHDRDGLPMRKKSGSVRVCANPPSGMVHTRIRASSHAKGETTPVNYSILQYTTSCKLQ